MSQISKSISHPTSWIFFAPFWRFHQSVHQIYFELFSARFKVHYGKSSGKWPFWQRAGKLVLYLLQNTILYLLQKNNSVSVAKYNYVFVSIYNSEFVEKYRQLSFFCCNYFDNSQCKFCVLRWKHVNLCFVSSSLVTCIVQTMMVVICLKDQIR